MANAQVQAQNWLSFLLAQNLPFKESLSSQIAAGKVGALCECGCHGFDFEVPAGAQVTPLQNTSGLFYEVAFASNFAEEIDVLLFTNERGHLCRVDITYGAVNLGAMPEEIVPGPQTGAWPRTAN